MYKHSQGHENSMLDIFQNRANLQEYYVKYEYRTSWERSVKSVDVKRYKEHAYLVHEK